MKAKLELPMPNFNVKSGDTITYYFKEFIPEATANMKLTRTKCKDGNLELTLEVL